MSTKMVEIDGKKFVDDLIKTSGKTKTELAREVYRDAQTFNNTIKRNNMNIMLFERLCANYKMNKRDYLLVKDEPKEVEETPCEVPDITIKTLQSMNATLFEINKTLKSVSDSMAKLNGYMANVNMSTAETKISMQKLVRSLG